MATELKALHLADLHARAAAAGIQGYRRMRREELIEILSEEIVRTMQLLQVTTLDELEPKHVTQLTRFAERRPRDLY